LDRSHLHPAVITTILDVEIIPVWSSHKSIFHIIVTISLQQRSTMQGVSQMDFTQKKNDAVKTAF